MVVAFVVISTGQAQVKDKEGERVRQGILKYLSEIREKEGELSAVEHGVKQILATEFRLKELKTAKIERDFTAVTVGIWRVDTKSGKVSIVLIGPKEIIHFDGSVTQQAGAAYRIELTEMARGHRPY